MKDKEMIEEMAVEDIVKVYPEISRPTAFGIISILKLGYSEPKIPEDSVVLSREEICELKCQAEEDFNKAYDLGGKETAEKILKDIMFCIDINDCNKNEMLILNLCKMLAKQFAVEIKE